MATVNSAAALVGISSRTGVVTALRRVRQRAVSKSLWIGSRSPYRGDASRIVRGTAPLSNRPIGEYVASSIALHCADGWTYLARSLSAAAQGDRATAVHMAYYAELRAAMSLLASFGIGVFGQRHVALEVNGGVSDWRRKTKGTHRDCWSLLAALADDPQSASLILSGVYIDGKPLSEIVDSLQGSLLTTRLAREWLRAWSLDLDVFSDDRDARNLASYRPYAIGVPPPDPINVDEEILDPLSSFWEAVEPVKIGRTASIDRHLLLRAIQGTYDSAGGTWDWYVDRLIGDVTSTTRSFLKQWSPGTAPRQQLFEWAATPGEPVRANPVMARALLLLRLASGLCVNNLSAAGVELKDIEFWWQQYGVDAGFWEVPPPIDDLLDMWSDISDSLDALDQARAAGGAFPAVRSLAPFLAEHFCLVQIHRATLWYSSAS